MRQSRKHSGGSLDRVAGEWEARLPSPLSIGIAAEAARIMARAEAMGLVDSTQHDQIDADFLGVAMRALADAGIGRHVFLNPGAIEDPEAALRTLNDSIIESPYPQAEWRSVPDVIGLELTSRLTGTSASSIKRYASGERDTPDGVAHRLHTVAMVVADLLGSYNHYGVRRWFERGRRALDGAAPAEILNGDWRPEDPGPARVAALAAALISSPLT
jgi:hypothetical protein